MIETGALYQLLFDRLDSIADTLLVGDNIAPKDGGWLQGQPNVSVFRPYVVLMQGPTTPVTPDRIVPSHSEWNVSFSVRTFAGAPAQLRTYSQRVRNAIDGFEKAYFGTEDVFKVVHTHFDQLGSLVRDDAVDPPYWQTFDAVRCEVSRSRNQP